MLYLLYIPWLSLENDDRWALPNSDNPMAGIKVPREFLVEPVC